MRYLIITAVFFLAISSFAQDVIYKKDGSKIEAKVLSISEYEVTYKKFQNLEGPNYTVLISRITTIVYENGDHEVFNDQNVSGASTRPADRPSPIEVQEPEKEKTPIVYGRNILALNYLDLIFSRISFSVEHIMSDGKVSVRVPVAFSINDASNSEFNFGNSYTKFKTGLDIYFYPGGQGKIRYLVGPSVRIRKEVNRDFFFSGGSQPSGTEFTSMGAYVNNGVLFQITESFNISLIAGLGLKNKQEGSDDFNDSLTGPHAFLEGNIGIRF